MTLHFTLILQVNTHCIAKYINSKIPSDSISEHLFFKSFLGGMPPDHLALACYACLLCFAQQNIIMHSCTMKLHFDYVACLQAPSYALIKYYYR